MFHDLSLTGRLPIPKLPMLQPMLQFGVILVDASEVIDEKRNHVQFYGNLGVFYSHKFSKQLEIGGDLGLGLSYAYFQNLDPSGDARSALLFNVHAGVLVGLNLSYNFILEINPRFKYTRSFEDYSYSGDLDTLLNGFSFIIGVSASYRFGEDPDSPKADIKSIKFNDLQINPLFASMQSFYVKNPIGQVSITNTEKYSLNDISLSFMQSGYMDNPTLSVEIKELQGGETKTVDLFATFNDQVFLTEGVKPLTGEVSVKYDSRGREVVQNTSVSYDLHDKEAMVWDDDRKVGAFITPKDSALRNYTSYLRQITRDVVNPGLSETLQIAMEVYYGLTEIGCLYQRDPTSPFDAAQENAQIVDAISLPRNTLKRATGDCDDLTVLFCSLLETAGIETAFITVPGHIYAAFNTKVAARNYKEIHPSKEMSINIDGSLWVPVEITMIGQADFSKAWRLGIEEFSMYENEPDRRALINTRSAQEEYRPIGLLETDLGLQYGEKSKIINDFYTEVDTLVNLIIDDYAEEANSKGNKGSYNKLGLICAKLGNFDKAESAFNTSLSIDRNYLPPKINLGNVFYMMEDYRNALRILHSAEKDYIDRGRTGSSSYAKVLLNISRSYYELENYDKAALYSEKMGEIDSELGSRYSYLSSS
ncbi:MAG: tetratricopeptide repeat protein, partial [Deltaproteobacteria bacterium]|nr:tetratricopeptide repeat protein [Deltaproteobacteria bacterium]